ncbi:MAG: hypothetical protein KTR14_07745 [Vampirovibrio sp.]|nr:hypothetical protein [Vampirovibrio sp.]
MLITTEKKWIVIIVGLAVWSNFLSVLPPASRAQNLPPLSTQAQSVYQAQPVLPPITYESLLRITRDQPIMDALQLLPGTPQESILRHILKRRVRVVFKDLTSLNKQLRDYDALSWLGPDGSLMVYINQKHRTAPPQALAALIAHEVIHDDPHNSLQEEITGWQIEAAVWRRMLTQYPALQGIAPEAYPLVDRLNRLAQEQHQGTLEQFVRNNPGYQGLPEVSPGFAPIAVSNPSGPLPMPKSENQ